jgi:outer membrane receptor protein involved in Fe transport
VHLTLGYRTTIGRRPLNVGVNINNLLDEDYFRPIGLGSGAWGAGREFRVSFRTEL